MLEGINVAQTITTFVFGALGALVIYALQKQLDELWPKRLELWQRLKKWTPLAYVAVGVGLLWFRLHVQGMDEPPTRQDVLFAAILAISTSMAVAVFFVERLLRIVERVNEALGMLTRGLTSPAKDAAE